MPDHDDRDQNDDSDRKDAAANTGQESEGWPTKDKKLSTSRENSEWLRDQTGEDHNLSGSSTYRTLPDQPDGKTDVDDTRDRQSNR